MSILLLVVAILVEQRQAVALESWGHRGEGSSLEKGTSFWDLLNFKGQN